MKKTNPNPEIAETVHTSQTLSVEEAIVKYFEKLSYEEYTAFANFIAAKRQLNDAVRNLEITRKNGLLREKIKDLCSQVSTPDIPSNNFELVGRG
jgi:DNA-binding phage protein